MRMHVRVLYLLVVGSFISSCVYDHRITQAIMERRRRAREAEGAKIRPQGSRSIAHPRHVGHVKFLVSDAYRAQHPAWKSDLEDLVDQASEILRPTFGVQLETAEVKPWTPACDASRRLSSCLDEIAKVNSGDGGTWVVGVLGAEPRAVTTFDELGMARSLGPHFLIRDVSDIAERAAIDRAFATFTESRRDEIYKKRKHHKRLAVFLHEWAHTLAGLHTKNEKDLLNPTYDDEMQAFSADNLGLISAALEDVFSHNPRYTGLSSHLAKASTPDFDPAERAALIAQLEVLNKPPKPEVPEPQKVAPSERDTMQSTHPYVVKGSDEQLLRELTIADRASYHLAVEAAWSRPDEALLDLNTLATRYADNYAVQHLRCGLAMQLGLMSEAQSACPRLESLKGNGAKSTQ